VISDAFSSRSALVLRADADARIGAGHVMRSLALAQAWKAARGRAVFCGRIDSASLHERLEAGGFECLVPGPAARDTVASLHDNGLDGSWVVLDGYHFDTDWHSSLVAGGFRVLVVDDEAKLSSYQVQAVLAPAYDASISRYATLPATVVMSGLKFRPLRAGFTGCRRSARSPSGGKAILVAFGAADSANVTCRALGAIAPLLDARDLVIVVLGPLNSHGDAVAAALSGFPCRHELHRDVVDMATLYGQADIALSAAGGAAWEMASCGLPAILVPVASNQEAGAAFLATAGAAVRLGGPQDLDSPEFPDLLASLLGDEDRRSAMALAGPQACDGRGAERVCTVLAALGGEQPRRGWSIRPARIDDLEAVHRIANDREVRVNSFSPEPIGLEDHTRWFIDRLGREDCALFVIEVEAVVAGLIRFDRNGDGAEIDYAIHPAFRGRGLGRRLLRDGALLAASRLGIGEATGVVIDDNAASRRAFLAAGYRDLGPRRRHGRDCRGFGLALATT
jgi:UDP-2,4-diacetamido-2,4,6-trideoxy-beta-L-altropyranose hydrolase